MNIINEAVRLSSRNRAEVEASKVCGCYFCLRVYPSSDVVEYHEHSDGGQTAQCPCCTIDAVLPGVDDEKILEEAHVVWFTEAA
jgi:hypothetical protein